MKTRQIINQLHGKKNNSKYIFIFFRERPGSSSGSLTRGDRSGPPASNVGKQDQRNSPSCEEEGIFKENPRVTYICSSLIGSTINVELDDGIGKKKNC